MFIFKVLSGLFKHCLNLLKYSFYIECSQRTPLRIRNIFLLSIRSVAQEGNQLTWLFMGSVFS